MNKKIENQKLFDKESFSLYLEEKLLEEEYSLFEILMNMINESLLDYEDIKKLLNNRIKEKLKLELEELNLLKLEEKKNKII